MKICSKCNKEWPYEFLACPLDGAPLVEKQQKTTGLSLNLGDANAISGGVNLHDSHNVNSVHNTSNVNNVTHNITQVAAQKTEMEFFQEKKEQYLSECKRAYEDNVLDQTKVIALEECRIKLGLDKATADAILESVRIMTERNARKTSLTPIAKTKLRILTENLQKNEVKALMDQIDSLEALVNRFDHDDLSRKYFLVLAALKPEKCIALKENSMSDNYWKSFWSYLAYIKVGRIAEAENVLITLDRFSDFPEDNMFVLAVAGALMNGNNALAKEYLNSVTGDYTPSLQRFVDSIYLLLMPERAEEMSVDTGTSAFYLINFFGQEDPKESARKEAEAKRMAEEEARRMAEAEARRKAEEEARRKAEEEASHKTEEEASAGGWISSIDYNGESTQRGRNYRLYQVGKMKEILSEAYSNMDKISSALGSVNTESPKVFTELCNYAERLIDSYIKTGGVSSNDVNALDILLSKANELCADTYRILHGDREHPTLRADKKLAEKFQSVFVVGRTFIWMLQKSATGGKYINGEEAARAKSVSKSLSSKKVTAKPKPVPSQPQAQVKWNKIIVECDSNGIIWHTNFSVKGMLNKSCYLAAEISWDNGAPLNIKFDTDMSDFLSGKLCRVNELQPNYEDCLWNDYVMNMTWQSLNLSKNMTHRLKITQHLFMPDGSELEGGTMSVLFEVKIKVGLFKNSYMLNMLT